MIRHRTAAFACAALLSASFAAEREALVIVNTGADAEARANAIGRRLEAAGFAVELKPNLVKDTKRVVEGFASRGMVGGASLLYYAGEGGRYDRRKSRTVVKEDGSKEKVYDTEERNGILAPEKRSWTDLGDLLQSLRHRSRARSHVLLLDCQAPPGTPEDKRSFLPVAAGVIPSGVLCLNQSAAGPALDTLLPALLTEDAALRDGFAKLGPSATTLYSSERAGQLPLLPSTTNRRRATGILPPTDPAAGDEWVNGLGQVYVWCPPGRFTMGEAGQMDAAPAEVTLSQGFWIGKYEFTLGDYVAGRGRTPLGKMDPLDANLPFRNTSVGSARDFAKKYLETKKQAEHLPAGWIYRLPTEAEWEYACRAGSSGRFGFGDDPARLHRHGNFADAALRRHDSAVLYADTSQDDGEPGLAPVGSYAPNAWGIHDMHGNVSEFVSDHYAPELPGGTDPEHKAEKDARYVHRGGAWCSRADYCAAGFRNVSYHHNYATDFIGYRLVLAKKKP